MPVRSIYLVRHAIAVGHRAAADDAARPLSPAGRTRMRRAAAGVAALVPGLDLIVSSPLVRAVETAEILAGAFAVRPSVVTMAALRPGGTSAAVAEGLKAHAKARSLALVGHEPGMGELAAWLTGAHVPPPFKKGGVCRIDAPTWPPDAESTLVWLATPRMLRALGH
jgi:phosphohistidine phosphatase